jgi:hypothetical protein
MRYVQLVMTAMMVMALAACTGEAGRERVSFADGGPMPHKDDSPSSGSSCSLTGTPADCDPVTASGCSSGDCYLLPDKGASCVCPGGTAAEGDSCSTTADCAPGHVCAGTSPPGVCRPLCAPDNDDCPAGTRCIFIDVHPDFGYCDSE